MFENIINLFKKFNKKEKGANINSKDAAKERLHLVLMQDRANVSVDFLELMKQEIIDVIKKYIDVDEKEIDVRLTNKENEDGTNGAPALYANIPIINIKNEAKKTEKAKNENKIEKNNTVKNSTEEKEERNVITEENIDNKEKDSKEDLEKKEIKDEETEKIELIENDKDNKEDKEKIETTEDKTKLDD